MLSATPALFLKEVRLSGNTVFSTDEFQPLIRPYLGRPVTAQELHELRQKLTLYYVEHGYINSGATIPDQNIEDGIVTISIQEGRLKDIRIDGNGRLKTSYIASRIAAAGNEPLNVRTLQDALLKLKHNPLIGNVNAHLKPGMRPGESELDVHVTEARPYQMGLTLDNSHPPSVGAEHLAFEGVHRNLTGHGDSLRLLVGKTRGLADGELDYWLPVTSRDTTIGLHYRKNDAVVIDSTFSALNITSKASSTAVSLRMPWEYGPEREFALLAKIERKWSETTMLGMPFSFSAGQQSGQGSVTALRLAQEWLDVSPQRIVSLRSTFSFGLSALGATINPASPDGRFSHWAGQLQWAKKINASDDSVHLRANFQVSSSPLLALEKSSIGGFDTVRGYRENLLVRDDVMSATVEAHIGLAAGGSHALELVPFFDTGKAWDKNAPAQANTLASLGAGLEWQPWKNTHARLYYGYALKKAPIPGSNLQDSGIHFRISSDFFEEKQ